MSLKSTPTRYGTVTIALHWLTAAAILGLFITGQLTETTDMAAKVAVLQWHAPLGLSVLVLTLARIAWWVWGDARPAPMGKGLQLTAAKLGHAAFYVLMIGMALSGIAMMALSGAGEVVFGGAATALPDFHDYLPRIPHGIGSKLLLALVVVHVAAAIWHQVVLKDGTMARMSPRAKG
jgi:cytochrome b561